MSERGRNLWRVAYAALVKRPAKVIGSRLGD